MPRRNMIIIGLAVVVLLIIILVTAYGSREDPVADGQSSGPASPTAPAQ